MSGKMAYCPWESSRGENNRSAKITEADVREMRAAVLPTEPVKLGAALEKLAAKYGITPAHCRAIRHRKKWKHVV